MRSIYLIVAMFVLLMACEDQIDPGIQEAPSILVIDAFLTDQDSIQSISITYSQSYFDNRPLPGAEGAIVKVAGSSGSEFTFTDAGSGIYQWDPLTNGPLAQVGDSLTLMVSIGEDTFIANSRLGRVPDIDSITFRFEEENLFFPDSYFAEFWSRDLIGAGDTYWVKAYKNGAYLNKPDEINIAYDAGFSEGSNVDGLIFIPPIRDAINPFEDDENDEFLSPYLDGDSVYVEIHSITNETFFFLNEVRIQTDRPGGFAELFANPLSNIRTNIIYTGNHPNLQVAGFFNVAAVKGAGKRLEVD